MTDFNSISMNMLLVPNGCVIAANGYYNNAKSVIVSFTNGALTYKLQQKYPIFTPVITPRGWEPTDEYYQELFSMDKEQYKCV